MTVATREVLRTPAARSGLVIRDAKPSESYYGGWLCGRIKGSRLCQVPTSTAPRKDMIIEGVVEHIEQPPFTASSTADSDGTAIDTVTRIKQTIRIVTAPSGPFDTGANADAITADHVGMSCYAYDNNTLYLTDSNGLLPRAGTVHHVDGRGKVWVTFDNKASDLTGDAPDFGSEAVVRNVITALGAYTHSSGTITATATGALGTQDGSITNVAGDEVWLPEYASTANSSVTVSAAISGPYEVIDAGGATSVVLRRPAWWPHGGAMPLGKSVKIAEGDLFGRSVWDIGAAKGSTIGTTDPSAYPREVIQQVALSSSAAVIANVPIRAAAKTLGTGVLITAGGTTTSTVGYRSIAAATPGPIGTASITIDAVASGGAKNGTSDTSTINASVAQQ